ATPLHPRPARRRAEPLRRHAERAGAGRPARGYEPRGIATQAGYRGRSTLASYRRQTPAQTAPRPPPARAHAHRSGARASPPGAHTRGGKSAPRTSRSSRRMDLDHLEARASADKPWARARDLNRLLKVGGGDDHVATD